MPSNLQLYIIKRIGQSAFVFFLTTIIVFTLINLAPGDPASIMLGPRSTEEASLALREKWGLHEPLYIQYVSWITNILQGDLGTSLTTGEPVTELILQRLPVTVTLGFFAMMISLLISVPAGIISSVYKDTPVDYGAMIFALLGVSMPNFWLGLMLIITVGLYVGWFPTYGYVSIYSDPVEGIRHIILPAIALGTAFAAVVTRMLRSSMLEVLDKEYINTARSKGISERIVIRKHALRNALIPTVTVVGLQVAYLLNGSILVETVFAIPGLGRLIADAVFQRNYPVVQGAVVVVAMIFIFVNLIVDLTYAYLDPQISYGDSQ